MIVKSNLYIRCLCLLVKGMKLGGELIEENLDLLRDGCLKGDLN